MNQRGLVLQVVLPEAKAPCCALVQGLAVLSSGWALTPCAARASSGGMEIAFLLFGVAQTY